MLRQNEYYGVRCELSLYLPAKTPPTPRKALMNSVTNITKSAQSLLLSQLTPHTYPCWSLLLLVGQSPHRRICFETFLCGAEHSSILSHLPFHQLQI